MDDQAILNMQRAMREALTSNGNDVLMLYCILRNVITSRLYLCATNEAVVSLALKRARLTCLIEQEDESAKAEPTVDDLVNLLIR